MEKPTLDTLLHRAVSDPGFRERLMADPDFAVSEAGYDFSPEDMAALRDWHAHVRSTTSRAELQASLERFVASRRAC